MWSRLGSWYAKQERDPSQEEENQTPNLSPLPPPRRRLLLLPFRPWRGTAAVALEVLLRLTLAIANRYRRTTCYHRRFLSQYLVPANYMEEYLSRRSKAAVGFLRRGSGISSRNQSPEERTSRNTDGPGSTTSLNPVKTGLSNIQERPRYLRDTFRSSSSKVIPGSSSRVPLRKFGEEKRRQCLLEGVDIAESSRRNAEAKHVEGSKKIVVEEESSETLQNETGGVASKQGQLVAPDSKFPHSVGSSEIPAHTDGSSVRSASLSSRTYSQKDKELNLGRPGYSCSSSFTNRPTMPRIPTTGAKPSYGLVNGEQRHSLKNIGCTSVSDVLPSGCSSDSAHNRRRFDAVRKRVSDGESSSRSRSISGLGGPSSLAHSPTIYPGISGSRFRTPEQLVSQQTIQSSSRNVPGSAVSVRTRRASPRDNRLRMSEERQDDMLSLHESTTRNQQSSGAYSSAEEVLSENFIRPFSVELPHAIFSSSRQGSNTRTARRRSSSRFEDSPTQTFHGIMGERDGDRRITMEGIAEVLLVLDRIEQEAELTYEQLRVLETNLLLGAFASHDQHSDMRMDIDNMSYEELLALEERIGSVSTALSEEQLVKCLRRSIYRPVVAEVSESVADDVKCSICQEEFMESEEVGQLRCGHHYHVCCIRQWLLQKNWCPICKSSALPSLN